MLCFTLPETFGKTLLYRKAKRLRAITGNDRITSEGEIENSKMTSHELIIDTLWRPLEITVMEPVVLLINIYIAMVYSILYLFSKFSQFISLELNISPSLNWVPHICRLLLVLSLLPLFIFQLLDKIHQTNFASRTGFPRSVYSIAIVGGILLTSGLFILVGQQIEPLIGWVHCLVLPLLLLVHFDFPNIIQFHGCFI